MYRNSSSGTANNYQSLLIIYIHTFVDKKNNFVYIKKKKNLKVDPEPKEKQKIKNNKGCLAKKQHACEKR